MSNYVVNRDVPSRGMHEVHESTCSNLPRSWNQRDLGWHIDCQSAVAQASLFYTNVCICNCCSK